MSGAVPPAAGACPYPDNFRISCRTVNLLNDTDYFLCGPNGKEVSINQYCTAYPPGARLAVYQPATTTSMAQLLPSIACPAGAWSSSTKFPVIVSFNGRTDCLCPVNSNVSCWFVSGPEARVAYPGGTAQAQTVFAGNGIDIPGKAGHLQGAGANSTAVGRPLHSLSSWWLATCIALSAGVSA
jgi:hypothetical protein